MSWGPGKTLAGGQRSIQRGQAAAGVQQIGLLSDFSEQRVALLTAGGEKMVQIHKDGGTDAVTSADF